MALYNNNLHFKSHYLNIGYCDSEPCLNNATCINEVYGYTCNCTNGYNGTHCESGIYIFVSLNYRDSLPLHLNMPSRHIKNVIIFIV